MEDNALYAEIIDIALKVNNSILEDELLYLSKKVQLMEYELHSLQDKLENEKIIKKENKEII